MSLFHKSCSMTFPYLLNGMLMIFLSLFVKITYLYFLLYLGCISREDCLRFSKGCQEGTHHGVPCVAHCCFGDLCNIGFGDEGS